MNSINMQSNFIQGDMLDDIMTRTMNEIHDLSVTVYGPHATEAFIVREGMPYYTKDGLEVLRSLTFDNELARYIQSIIYQAAHMQGTKIGDGTTTLAVLYTNIYHALKSSTDIRRITRDSWNAVMADINEGILNSEWYSATLSKDTLPNAVYTCTQDLDITSMICNNIGQALLDDAYITISKSNISADIQVTTSSAPTFKATKKFSIKPLNDTNSGQVDNCVILHCNGILDITQVHTFVNLMNMRNANPITFIILCNGLSEVTRNTIKQLLSFIRTNSIDETTMTNISNVAIFTLDEYRGYSKDQIEDISTIITDEYGIGGLVDSITFESLLYQAIQPEIKIEELEKFDTTIAHIDKMRTMFSTPYTVEIDPTEGIRIHKELGPVAQARYNNLLEEITEEKSEVAKIAAVRRLKLSFGKYIHVEIGSNLIKDSQRKYELVLDTILSMSSAVEHGILKANSLLVAYDVMHSLRSHYYKEKYPASYIYTSDVIISAMCDTIVDMVSNHPDAHDIDITSTIGKIINDNAIIETFNLFKPLKDVIQSNVNYNRTDKSDDNPFRAMREATLDDSENTNRSDNRNRASEDVPGFYWDEEMISLHHMIVEPVKVIQTLLTNSTLIFELATAKAFNINSFMQNYI